MKTSASCKRLSAGIAATFAITAAAAPLALAGGEPKNESPFTRPALTASFGRELGISHLRVVHVSRGESKNQSPFTRR